jgi:hypothetical protein
VTNGVFVLISEARGEFLVVELIREEMRRLGVETVHVTAGADDVTAAERAASSVIVLEEHDAYLEAQALAQADLAGALDDEQAQLHANLRRIWKADLRSWRERATDEKMARIAIGSLRAWREVLDGLGPAVGLWGEDGGHLVKQAAFLLAGNRGIPRRFVYVSPLPKRLLVLDNPLNRFDANAFGDTVPTEEELAYAESFLADIRASRVQFATPRDLSFGVGRVVRFARLLLDAYVSRPPGARSLYPGRFARMYLRQRGARAALRRVYSQLGEAPFVFLPIHAGFDAQISIRAPQWENQLALIEHVAASLPYGYELAIKEHPFEVGALPLQALRALLRRRPEVRLLDPGIHAHAVLRRCRAVATINSTTGFEALFFRRPVVTYGYGPYRGLGLTRDVENPFESPGLLLEAVTGQAPEEKDVIKLVAFLLRNSYPGVSLAYDVGADNARRHAEIFAALSR